MDWLSFKGTIVRTQFLIRMVTILSLSYLILYFAYSFIPVSTDKIIYLTTKSAIDLFITLICLPTIVKRLRSINWSVNLAGIFFVICIFNVRNVLLVASNVSPMQFYLISSIEVVSLIILLCLLFKKSVGANENTNPGLTSG